MNTLRLAILSAICLFALFASLSSAIAGQSELDPILRVLVAKGVLTLEEARSVQGEVESDRRSDRVELADTVQAEVTRTVAEAEPVRSAPEWTQRLKFGGKAYLRYSYELEDDRDDFNEFDVDRVYLTFDWKVAERAKLRARLEAGELREDKTGSYDVTLKALYLELKDPIYDGSFVRFGQTGLPWVSYDEGIWQYRFQNKVFPDRFGYLTSTDLGIALGGEFPSDHGSWQVNVANGEGWKKNEIGKHKDVHARVSLAPFAGLGDKGKNFSFSGFGSTGTYDDVSSGPDDRCRVIGQIAYREKGRFTLGGEYLWASDPADKMKKKHPSLALRPGEESDAEGFSLFAIFNFGLFGGGDRADDWEFIARWDRLDPDDEIEGNDLDHYIVGFSHKFNKWAKIFVGYEEIDYDNPAALVALGEDAPDESRFLVQSEIKF